VSEAREIYSVDNNLLHAGHNHATLEQEPLIINASVDWAHFERILIPLLNLARKEQGKRPVIVPKG
jgi:calcineurin-like phosphoesterase family protein